MNRDIGLLIIVKRHKQTDFYNQDSTNHKIQILEAEVWTGWASNIDFQPENEPKDIWSVHCVELVTLLFAVGGYKWEAANITSMVSSFFTI